MTDANVADWIYREGGMIGMWPCLADHWWGGLTMESTSDGHRIGGNYWFIYMPKIKTVSSTL